jgi:hypothetical protein
LQTVRNGTAEILQTDEPPQSKSPADAASRCLPPRWLRTKRGNH